MLKTHDERPLTAREALDLIPLLDDAGDSGFDLEYHHVRAREWLLQGDPTRALKHLDQASAAVKPFNAAFDRLTRAIALHIRNGARGLVQGLVSGLVQGIAAVRGK